uniref:RRM domain-containing protein n=1 Tax=Branchiostoma floridae TaxID=7739 RepID=C3Y0R8_BRAFL|eukprot:XP_002610041.1 hypothetical protein BRAFLDRAFT_129224 [Branchiostoma floridae]
MESKKIMSAGLFLDGYTVGGVANFLAKQKTPNSSAKKKLKTESVLSDLSALFSPTSPFSSSPGIGSSNNSSSVRQHGKRKAEDSTISSKKKVKELKTMSSKEESNNTVQSPQTTTRSATTTATADNTQSQGSKKGKRKNKSMIPAEGQPVKKSSVDDVPVAKGGSKTPPENTTTLPKNTKKRRKRKSSDSTQGTTEQVTVEDTGQVQVSENCEPLKKKRKRKKKKTNATISVPASDTLDNKDGTAGSANVQGSKNTVKKSPVSQQSKDPNAKKDLEDQDETSRKKKKRDSKILSERESLLKNADQAEQTRKEQVKKKQEEKKKMMTITELEDANPTPGKTLRDPERDQRTVFVGNLPVSTTKKELKKMFRKFGEIESVRFRSIFDHKLSIFVGNLPFDVEDDSVYEHFSQCGEVEGVRIIRDSKSGLGKGFGYVLFQDSASVGLAIRLNEKTFSGRKIRVKRAVKKEKVKNTSFGSGSASKGNKPFLKGKFSQKSDQGLKSHRKDKFQPKDKAMGLKKKQGGKKERWRNKPGFKGGMKSRGK